MLHWWGFSPVGVGGDSKQDRARHSEEGEGETEKQDDKKTKMAKLKKMSG